MTTQEKREALEALKKDDSEKLQGLIKNEDPLMKNLLLYYASLSNAFKSAEVLLAAGASPQSLPESEFKYQLIKNFSRRAVKRFKL